MFFLSLLLASLWRVEQQHGVSRETERGLVSKMRRKKMEVVDRERSGDEEY